MPLPPDSPSHTKDIDRLRRAISLAAFAHGTQVDKSGELYWWHVLRVGISLLPDVDAAIVGVLHDVAEDTGITGEPLLQCTDYSQEVMTAMYAITHQKWHSYEEYIREVATSPLAIKVKLADLADNSNPERLAKLPTDVRTRLEAKYASAKKILQEIQRSTKGETHEAQSHPRNDSAEPAGDSSHSPESFPEGTGGEAPNRNPFSRSY